MESSFRKMWLCGTSNCEQVGFENGSFCAGSVGVVGNSRCIHIIDVFADKQWLNTTCSGVYRLHLTKWATAPGAARDAQVFCDDKSLGAKPQLLPGKQTQGLCALQSLNSMIFPSSKWTAQSTGCSKGEIFSVVHWENTCISQCLSQTDYSVPSQH